MPNKLHVLVVEDDPKDRELIRRNLDELNVDSTTYETGDQAICTFKRSRFDGVLLDHANITQNFLTCVGDEILEHKHIPIMLYSKHPIDDKLDIVVMNREKIKDTLRDFVQLLQKGNHHK